MVFKAVAVLALCQVAFVLAGPGIDFEIEGRQYFVSDDAAGALASINVCDGKGMKLINLETRAESEAIFAWLQSQPDQVDKRFWSGASRRSGSDQWTWSIAGDFDLAESHWAFRYPHIELEFDAEIVIQGSLGGWSDDSTFGLRLHQLCEKYE